MKINSDLLSLSNTYGTSTSNGYSQSYINDLRNWTKLYGNHANAYTHEVTLLDDALKYKTIVMILGPLNGNASYAVWLPVINNIVYSSGITFKYQFLEVISLEYVQNTKYWKFQTITWLNSSNNSGVTVQSIWGIK